MLNFRVQMGSGAFIAVWPLAFCFPVVQRESNQRIKKERAATLRIALLCTLSQNGYGDYTAFCHVMARAMLLGSARGWLVRHWGHNPQGTQPMPPSLTIAAGGKRARVGRIQGGKDCPSVPLGFFLARVFFILYFEKM